MQRIILATSFLSFCAFSTKALIRSATIEDLGIIGLSALITCVFGVALQKFESDTAKKLTELQADMEALKKTTKETKDQLSVVSVGQGLRRS